MSVTIVQENTSTGVVVISVDNITGLIMSGYAIEGIDLGDCIQIFSLDEAKAKGITPEYDSEEGFLVYKHISDFYSKAPRGTELWFMLVANTVTLTQMADVTNAYATRLRDAAEGRITMLGITRVPDGGYEPDTSEGIDGDVLTAITKAQAFSVASLAESKPLMVLVEGRGLTNLSTLKDLRLGTDTQVGVIVGNDMTGQVGNSYGCVGLALGMLANRKVSQSLGRVKSGDAGISAAGLSNGVNINELSYGQIKSVYDKGYCLFKKYQGKNGYFWYSNPNASSKSNSINSISTQRVLNKASRIAYATYIEEQDEDVEILVGGTINPVVAKSLEGEIIVNISNAMAGEISGVSCVIDLAQNIEVPDSNLEVRLKITKRVTLEDIVVKLYF
jgi:hypothetical protein